MQETVMETMQKYDMYKEDGVVLAAVSGGRDSMALLCALHSLQKILNFHLRAVHVNHNLRENAKADQRLVEQYANNLNVPLQTVDVRVREGRKGGESVEMAARRLRYAAFQKALDAYPKETVLATAHHLRDQAETVLMRLLRGTGLRGLAGIHPVRGAFVRPMLYVPDEDIERYAAENAVPYRMDESNMDIGFVRNRIRHALLPGLKEQYNPNLERALGAMAKAAHEDETYLQELAGAQREALGWRCIPGLAVYMRSEVCLALPQPLQKRVIRLALESLGFHHMEESTLISAVSSIHKGGVSQVSKDVFIRGGHYIQVYRMVAPNGDEEALPIEGMCRLGMFRVESKVADKRNGKSGVRSACVREDLAHDGLRARTRRAGDTIAYGYGHKKLSDALIDNRIPFCIRDHLPVLLCGGEVVWVPGLRVADRFAPDQTDKRVIQITVDTYDGGIGNG